MVIDSSAVVAVVFREPEQAAIEDAIAASAVRLISAASLLESAMVIEARFGDRGAALLDEWLVRLRIIVAPIDEDQIRLARQAWRRYGKGRHPAALNFGDCLSYALAAATGEPLLFKGDDFSRTDVARA